MKRAKTRGDSRARLVETTAQLLRVQGYHATGLNQIVEESEAPKGSLYHYFPQGKEELAAEALGLASQATLARLRDLFSNHRLKDALALLVEQAIADLEASDYQHGCPIATVALETVSCDCLQTQCANFFRQAISLLEEAMKREGVPPDKVPGLAQMSFAAYEGAVLLSRVLKSPAPLRQVAAQIKLHMKLALS
ncbi:MAG: TetR family transcriptional regulator [Candidatus Xenobia bacterium]|jgi:TetR/AcrR family transcriptional repressor of lmrAB and yxaGH operons